MTQITARVRQGLARGVRAALALVLAVGLMPTFAYPAQARAETSDFNISSAAYTEASDAGAELRETLTENADTQLTGSVEEAGFLDGILEASGAKAPTTPEGLKQSGKYLYVKYTLADASMIDESETIDSMFASEEKQFALVTQYAAHTQLYELDKDAAYYAAYVDAPGMTDTANAQDYIFALNDNDGNVIEDALYDNQTGIAYIPKSYYEQEDIVAVQMQLLYRIDIAKASEETPHIKVTVDGGGAVDVPQDVSAQGGAFDVGTTIQVATPETAASIDLDNIEVRLNGETNPLRLDEDTASYNPETGELELRVNSLATSSIDVDINKNTGFIAKAHAVSASGDWFLHDQNGKVVLRNLTLDTLNEGDLFKMSNVRVDYHFPANPDNDIANTVVGNVGQYCYVSSTSPASLYNLIANGDGKGGSSWWDATNAKLDKTGSALKAAGGYFVGACRAPCGVVSGQNWEGIGNTSGSYGIPMLALQCSHISDGVTSALGNASEGSDPPYKGNVWWRVLKIKKTGSNPYLIFGICDSAIAGQAGVGVYKVGIEQQKATLSLTKTSSNTSITNNNDCYSLKGAKYGIYESNAAALSGKEEDREETLTVNEDGTSNTVSLTPGDYWVSEYKAPKGYKLNSTPQKVTLAANDEKTITFEDTPITDPARLVVQKQDPETGKKAEGGATLQGAEFTYNYYDGFYKPSELPASPTRSWVLKTNASGKANLEDGDTLKVSGDAFYKVNGAIEVPLGTLAVTETKAPVGYRLGYNDKNGNFQAPKTYVTWYQQNAEDAEQVDVISKNYEGDGAAIETLNLGIDDVPERGNITGGKRDSGAVDGKAQGKATLAGAAIEVINNTGGPVVSPQDGQEKANGEVVCVLMTDETGAYSTTNAALNGWSIPKEWGGKALLVGNYTLRESAPPQGYLLNTDWRANVTITSDSQTVHIPAVTDPVKRGDMSFVKKRTEHQTPLKDVAFVMVSKTTGEAHTLVTDANGMISTASSFNEHSKQTNANDAAISVDVEGLSGEAKSFFEAHGSDMAAIIAYAKEHVDEIGELLGKYVSVDTSKLKASAGTWFYGHADAATGEQPNNALGALPYDTYHIFELPSKANEGLVLVDFDFTEERNGTTIDYGTIADQPSPRIGTELTDSATGSHTAIVEEQSVLKDTVWFDYFELGEYTFEGELHLVAPDGTDTGIVATNKTTKNVTLGSGKVEVGFKYDTTTLEEGTRLVAFERAYNAEGTLVAEHTDINDAEQTVLVPRITTTLTNDGTKQAASTGEITLTDRVEYKELTPERRYTMHATLHKRNADGTDAGVLLDAKGHEVTKRVRFTPEESSGTVDVNITFEPADGGGYDVVAFEECIHQDEVYAVHADITDEAQTVYVPGIKTTALDKRSGTHTGTPTKKAIVRDKVDYSGLIPLSFYTIRGELVSKTDNKTVATAEVPITTSTEGYGSVELEFAFDATELEGGVAVVFEELVSAGQVVAEHKDINDANQTVSYPSLTTTATDGQTEKHEGDAVADASLIDAVSYRGIEAGKNYILKGTLMDKATEEAFRDPSGRTVTAQKEFKANAEAGTINMVFQFDGSALEGATLVVFEQLWASDGEEPVAIHEDINDKNQSVAYKMPPPNIEEPPPGKITPPENTTPPNKTTEPPKVFDRTSDWLRTYWWVLLVATGLAALGTVLYTYGRKHMAKAKDTADTSEPDSQE